MSATGETRQFIREVTLRVIVEQKAIADQRLVESFLVNCERRGVGITWRDGKLRAKDWDKLGADLKAVLTIYRLEIEFHLQRVEELERRTEIRLKGVKPCQS